MFTVSKLSSHVLSILQLFYCVSFVIATSPTHGTKLDTRGYSVNPRHEGLLLTSRDLPIGECDKDTPCSNGACCSKTNKCGYSESFCGSGCQHNCDAKAECGPYGRVGSQKCPLNVCCSKFGFCGSTSEFCVWENDADPVYPTCDTKYGGCGAVNRPSCGGASVSKRTIGYYESWSNSRTCQKVAPEDLNIQGFTHINFAFSFFDHSTFQITSMDSNAASLYQRFTSLKAKASGLQTWISIGGWSFTDPGPTKTAFSVMVSSKASRTAFINGLIQFMSTYGFDGCDLDWEYPGADDRGGKSADGTNYVLLVQEMRAAFGGRFGISMTLPTSYWYLQHFDLSGVQPHIDWFNLMSYDLHGTWDAASKFLGPHIAPHTNITEIDLGMDLLWRAGVTPDKVVLGQAWYGRSFTLADPACRTPNGSCKFSGPANAGPCSNAPGILDNQEISDIISSKGLKPVWDKIAGVKWIDWDGNQWVSYDDADTFQQKRDFANKRCLGGLMVWAMDQVNQGTPNGLGQAAGITPSQQSDAQQLSSNQLAGITCRYAGCGQECPVGSTKVTESNGQPGQLSTSSRCTKGKYQPLCCDDGTTMGKCRWRGFRGAGLSCMGGCANGEIEVTTNKNNHNKKGGDQTCNGGLQSFCCAGFTPGPSKAKLEQDAKDAAKAAGEAAGEQALLDVTAKAFCRAAVPALLLPLELAEDLVPIIGEILDIAEVAATPALIQACIKGIEKEGKAEFKVFGKKHTLSMGKPDKPPETRPPSESHKPPKTTSKDRSCSKAGRDLEKRACPKTVTRYTATDTIFKTVEKVCVGKKWPQACFHYSSAAQVSERFKELTCSPYVPDRRFLAGGTATKVWGEQHVVEWRQWMRRSQKRCQRDEWPPQHFWQGDPDQLIRYNHAEDNTGAGSLWRGFCPENAETRCDPNEIPDIVTHQGRQPDTVRCRQLLTLSVMSMKFDMDGFNDDERATAGLAENQCYPMQLIDDPSFALLNDDPYFKHHEGGNRKLWGSPPDADLTKGETPGFPPGNRKRDLSILELIDLVFDNGTFSHLPTDEQLEARAEEVERRAAIQLFEKETDQIAYVKCIDGMCATQATPVGRASVTFATLTRTAPPKVEATPTPGSFAV